MPQADVFRCNICGEMQDITNDQSKVTHPDGKQRTITRSYGYYEIRFLDYGARTTVTVKCCATCKSNVMKGSNTKTLTGSKTSVWSE